MKVLRAAEHGNDAERRFVHGDFYEAAKAQVGRAHELGVTILAGTDSTNTLVFSGASLHDELAMLVDAGLTPLAALRAATIDAASFAGVGAESDNVTVGKRAD